MSVALSSCVLWKWDRLMSLGGVAVSAVVVVLLFRRFWAFLMVASRESRVAVTSSRCCLRAALVVHSCASWVIRVLLASLCSCVNRCVHGWYHCGMYAVFVGVLLFVFVC